jgi:hypothetical protein
MPQGWATFVGAPPAVAALTGLQRLELCSNRLPSDTLLHLAVLTGLTSLSVRCHRTVPALLDDGSSAAEQGGQQAATATLLSHLGALSGLTRLSSLFLRDFGDGCDTEGAMEAPPPRPPEALLAVLPSAPSLTEVGWRAAERGIDAGALRASEPGVWGIHVGTRLSQAFRRGPQHSRSAYVHICQGPTMLVMGTGATLRLAPYFPPALASSTLLQP